MCGFVVWARDAGGQFETNTLRAATRLLRHRGPDDEGFALWSESKPVRRYSSSETSPASCNRHGLVSLPSEATWRVGFGHRRLAIIDLSAQGHQPFIEGSGTKEIALVYNGEIYNFEALRIELEARGHRFASLSDTEVLAKCWLEWQEHCLEKLNGIFAFVVLDLSRHMLFAVRDRFGVKPLYYSRIRSSLVFASEIKAFLAVPGFSAEVDEDTAASFLSDGTLDANDQTLFRYVRQLSPGAMMSLRLDAAGASPAFQEWYRLRPAEGTWQSDDLTGRFRELFFDSVRLQLRADVPVGTCMSGGLDSTAVACAAHVLLGGDSKERPQITVTASFDDEACDEWKFASEAVRRIKAEAVRVWPSMAQLRRDGDAFLWHQDEPTLGPGMFSQWCVFEGAARAGLKVTLDGQGSDEMLAGYLGNEASVYARLLRGGHLIRVISEIVAYRSLHRRWPIWDLGAAVGIHLPPVAWLIDAVMNVRSVPDDVLINAPRPRRPRRAEFPQNLISQLRETLPHLLHHADRSSMAFGIESRVPFLDHRLVELALALPPNLIYWHADRKVVLRRALKGVMPDSIRLRRDKMGFATPEAAWFNADVDWFREGIEEAVRRAPQLLNRGGIDAKLETAAAGRSSFDRILWRTACFGRWQKVIVAKRTEIKESLDVELPKTMFGTA